MFGNNKPRLVFIHIPKCGGVSLRSMIYRSALKQGYRKSKILIPGQSHHLSYDTKYKDIASISDYKIIAGHYLPEGITQDDVSFTFLREPIKRYISHFYFFCYKKSKGNYQSNKTLSEMNESELERFTPLGNLMTKWLCSIAGEKSKPSVEMAMDVLFDKLTGYGILNEMDKSIQQLNSSFSNKFELKTPKKLNQRKKAQAEESKSTIEFLAQINRLDLFLYHEAQRRLTDEGIDLHAYKFSKTISEITDITHQSFKTEFINNYLAEDLERIRMSPECYFNGYVSRKELAVLLLKAVRGKDFIPPPAKGTFSDVDTSSRFAPWIEKLVADGISGGCDKDCFCPENTITRAQIAVLMVRAWKGSNFIPPAAKGQFADVPVDWIYAPWIEFLAEEKIMAGYDDENYCPDVLITRAQMVKLVSKVFALDIKKKPN